MFSPNAFFCDYESHVQNTGEITECKNVGNLQCVQEHDLGQTSSNETSACRNDARQ